MSEESNAESAENQHEHEEVLNIEQDPEQVEPEIEAPSSTESDESVPGTKEPYVDQEMADAYGFTPQQAKEMGLYL